MKSELDKYQNLSLARIKGGHFCIDNQRFIKDRPMSKSIDDLDRLLDSSDKLASEAIEAGDIGLLGKADTFSNSLDSLEAKIELNLAGASFLSN